MWEEQFCLLLLDTNHSRLLVVRKDINTYRPLDGHEFIINLCKVVYRFWHIRHSDHHYGIKNIILHYIKCRNVVRGVRHFYYLNNPLSKTFLASLFTSLHLSRVRSFRWIIHAVTVSAGYIVTPVGGDFMNHWFSNSADSFQNVESFTQPIRSKWNHSAVTESCAQIIFSKTLIHSVWPLLSIGRWSKNRQTK